MANTLLITKETGNYFSFVLNGNTANKVTSIKNDLLAVGEQLHFKTANGANIIKEQFIYPANLTVVSGGTFTFTSVAEVWSKLIEIGFFDWISSSGGSGASRFDDLLDTFKYTGKDGKAIIVNESQQKLEAVTIYNYKKFTELQDTPTTLVPNKMVVVNTAGDALILQDQPAEPEQYLNSVGYFDYNDAVTQTTPLTLVANTAKKLTNDTLGAFTNVDQPPYGVSSLWDNTTNQFNFTQLSIGDTIDVRIHLVVTTTTSNQKFNISAKFGVGSASVFENIIYDTQIKTAGANEVSFVAPFYIGSNDIKNNPAELYITSDASGSLKVNGFYIRVLRKNINIVSVETGVDDASASVKGILRLAGDLGGTATNPTVPDLANKVPKTRTITINGTAFDLTADRSWTITNTTIWGQVGGTLSNQTDLQNALNAKQATLGGTGFVKSTAGTISYDTNTYATITNLNDGLDTKENIVGAGTTAQYYRGDKTWQTLPIYTLSGLGGIGGSGTTNYLPKFTGASTLGNSLIYDNGTNVGIGTTTIDATYSPKLHIESSASDGTGGLFIGSYLPTITLKDYSGGATVSQFQQDGTNLFIKNNGNAITLASSGNVGIGTTAPNSNTNRTTLTLNNSAWGGQLDINVGGTNHAQFGTDNFNSGLSCRIQSQDGIVFNAGGANERMRITSGGNVGIGTTAPAQKLDVSGNVKATSFIKSGGTSSQFLMADGSVSTGTGSPYSEFIAESIASSGTTIAASIMYNTTSYTTITRVSAGTYNINFAAGALNGISMAGTITNATSGVPYTCSIYKLDNQTIRYTTYSSGALSDNAIVSIQFKLINLS